MIERKKSAIETLVANTRAAAEMAAQRSFEAKIGAIAHEMPRRLEGLKLGIEGFWDKLGAGTIKNQKWVKATAERINAILREELETWAGADNDHEGLARDLKPSMDQMVSSLRDHVEDISDIVMRMRTRIAALDANLSSEGKIVGDIEMVASLISATLLGGPLGVVGLGGWRGVAGAVGGFVGASFAIGLVTGILHLAFPPTAIVTLVAAIGALGGAAWGSTVGLENRLKDKAWKEVEPKLRELAHDPKALSELRSSINNWFNEIRGNLPSGYRADY